MKETIEYEMFKKHPSNREIDEFTVQKLQRSISIKNLLEFRPIMVNKKMEVIDGQHRLEAAKRLGVPVFYQVQADAEAKDILILNANQTPWNKTNYLEFFVKEGKPHYVELHRFMKKHSLDLGLALAFLGQDSGVGRNKGSTGIKFKSGDYIFPNPQKVFAAEIKIEQIKECKEFIRERISGNKQFLNSSRFTRGLCYLMNYPDFEFSVLLQKIPFTLNIFSARATESQYVDMFKQAYNWKNKKPLGNMLIESAGE